jgi:HNH endonuclease
MTSVVLQPNSNGTPGGSYAVQDLKGLLGTTEYAILIRAAPTGQVVAYGKPVRDAVKWDRIAVGDLALFYHRRLYFAAGRVALTVKNGAVAKRLWGSDAYDEEGNIHDRMIFYTRLRPLALPSGRLNRAAGYSPTFVLQGFQVLHDIPAARVTRLLRGKAFELANASTAAGDIAFVQDIDTVVEGQDKLVQHIRRERNRTLIAAKKADAKRRTGKLACEICAFNFHTRYPFIEQDFAEVHHKAPLGSLDGPRRTSLTDLAILCANCHRMIHRTYPMMTIATFRRAYRQRGI